MENKKNLLVIILGILAILASLLGIDLFQTQTNSADNKEVWVERVIDGDTIQVRDIKNDKIFNVRYLGIDTPELDGLDYETCFGSQAKEKTRTWF